MELIVEAPRSRGRPRLTESESVTQKEKRKAYQKELREKYPELVSEYKRKWYLKNKQKLMEIYKIKKSLYMEYLKCQYLSV
jgi:hypothetical protein